MKPTRQPTTTLLPDPMRPSALLRGAATYLDTHGWTQHQFYDLLADTDGPFPPACTSGAIMTVATGQCLPSGSSCLGGDEETIAALLALRVLAAWVDLEYTPMALENSAIDVIGDWNDYDDRTVAEVIETLTDAANDWDAIHHIGGPR
ncbi:hypothetical protein ACFY36_36080 [Actinoplanes sp. NPDC000266]